MFRAKRTVRPKGASYSIHVVGAAHGGFGDAYHAFLAMPWTAVLTSIGAGFLAINAVFAALFTWSGGIANARPHSFADAFNFSVQTLATIGYGAMYPASAAANALVDAESVVSVVVTALATGLIFAKFARPTARILFSTHATIAVNDGAPTLAFRLGNERGSSIAEASANVAFVRTVRNPEGSPFYKILDLKLTRNRSPAVARSWTVMHVIDESSPLFGATPESLEKDDAEFLISLAGTDDTSYQPVFARYTYEHPRVLWGARHADILSEAPNGDLILDVRRFHDTVATTATESFPYPRVKT